MKTTARRSFLRTTAGVAGWMLIQPRAYRSSAANSKITLGVIGCGGRGFFIGKKFMDNVGNDVHLVSAHDYFADRLERFQNLFDIPADRCYTGFKGYQEILASNVDGVIITSPPYFHPEHAAQAVAAGKHVWLCKPVAVDVPGALDIIETGKKAQGKVTLLVDFQSRNSPCFVEAVKRVREGAIGELVSGQAFNHFPCGGLAPTAGMSHNDALIRNWGTNPVLSGDVIVEQAVHAVDIANWIAGARPTKAFGTGGLKARLNAGKNWDHFLVTYWYGDGPKVDLNVAQFTRGYEDLGARFYGTKGVVDAHYRAIDWGHGPVTITGDNAWPGTDFDNTWDIGVDNNCKDFVASIRNGRYLNHADYAAESTLTSILGRQASYEERVVTWEEMIQENKKLDPGFES
ncbi:MAG TPA: Gfo/Idh/MocA family oxidoreductase [bacterium]|nr:Gfo/Idh/MocA family oxidoreductase [bacterium]